MSDIIRLLPDSVANQIAAGEVVQRPASVVKELLENSIDAGATHIELRLTDAGKSCIQVIDDGKGMSETDARLSFERHATSKIAVAQDLFNLHTMGFRGEALASIAAVAQVELVTRTANDEIGTAITIEGAHFTNQQPAPCPQGANFSVRNLFYNVPARRRFLKSNTTEQNNNIQEFERVALINPAISFKLYRDDTLALTLTSGTFKQRILALFGQNLDRQLLPLTVETDLVKIEGFVGTPESARHRGARQYLFVNGRYMRHSYFNKAVLTAYERLIPSDKQPPYFICFTVDPTQIDVNIHPSKTEIKFQDERAIWQLLLVAVKDALARAGSMPTIDFDNTFDINIPSFRVDVDTQEPQPNVNPYYNPFDTHGVDSQKNAKRQDSDGRAKLAGWQNLYDSIKDTEADKEDVSPASLYNLTGNKFLFLEPRYILTPANSGLMVIDSIRARRRILYDTYMGSLASQGPSQPLLFPETLELDADQASILETLLPSLTKAGFDIARMSATRYAVNAVPAVLNSTPIGNGGRGLVDIPAIITHLIDSANQSSSEEIDVTVLHHNLALALARRNAPTNEKMGNSSVLEQNEMTAIIDQLFATQTPSYTPDGKSIIAILPKQDISNLFDH